MERQVARVEYANGYADAYDARGVMLSRQRCDRLLGYGLCRDAGQLLLGSQGEWLQRHAADDPL